ncbi:hypothetical protein PILCRDRAFT_86514 [Piloderma croceum F 1598]|uniref:Uncharacterized protein n=1 Tax=Piloderma croceum (strain F 1598) TaxID=765440 RepID=A0A0C3G356_PILCF|nr:hypothetical protein PILCRDRAFT_86514 [Piloderma croceum F 1598]
MQNYQNQTFLGANIWICSDALGWLRHIRRVATPIIRTMGLAATAEGLVGPARHYMEWARRVAQNDPRIENLVWVLCAGFAQHMGAFLHDEHFRQLDRNIQIITIFTGGSETGNLLSSTRYDQHICHVIFPSVLRAVNRLFPAGLEAHINTVAQRLYHQNTPVHSDLSEAEEL